MKISGPCFTNPLLPAATFSCKNADGRAAYLLRSVDECFKHDLDETYPLSLTAVNMTRGKSAELSEITHGASRSFSKRLASLACRRGCFQNLPIFRAFFFAMAPPPTVVFTNLAAFLSLEQWFSTRKTFLPWWHLARPGLTFGGHKLGRCVTGHPVGKDQGCC